MSTSFFAYPSKPVPLVAVIEGAHSNLKRANFEHLPHLWKNNDVPGRFLRDPILDEIQQSTLVFSDITYDNFNVAYEIGYAIGRGKRPYLLKNSALVGEDFKEGFLGTIGYGTYGNIDGLVHQIKNAMPEDNPLFRRKAVDKKQPTYYIRTSDSLDFEIRTLSRIKKARLGFRVHDVDEHGPLNVLHVLEELAVSNSVVLHFLNSHYRGAQSHNYKMAFVAGLAHASEMTALLLQNGNDPVPIDYRDLVKVWEVESQIDTYIGDFAAEVYGLSFTDADDQVSKYATGISSLSFGATAAENELDDLKHYYIQTSEFLRCLRGEVLIVTGRKGVGKTAAFSQVRNRIRRDRKNIVLDLQPEGFQILKFKETISSVMSEGSREHVITAFWEYLLLLEICHKILVKDRQVHLNDHQIREPYFELRRLYEQDEFVAEGDFAERMLRLLARIEQDFASKGLGEDSILAKDELTEILYRHDLRNLRIKLVEYLQFKGELRILFDNLDKGWPPQGVGSDDVAMIRCLLAALGKLQKELRREDIKCFGTVFLRNDVYDLLVEQTSDRGKIASANLDWADPALLREMLRLRIVYSLELDENLQFEEAWSRVSTSHYRNEHSAQYLIDRCMMRPRFLLELVQQCVSHAVNVGNSLVMGPDIEIGESQFSSQIMKTIGYELRDVLPEAEDFLYQFIGANRWLLPDDLNAAFETGQIAENVREQLLEYLLWYGVLGVVRESSVEAYIYDVYYDMKRLRQIIEKSRQQECLVYCLNPSLNAALELQDSVGG